MLSLHRRGRAHGGSAVTLLTGDGRNGQPCALAAHQRAAENRRGFSAASPDHAARVATTSAIAIRCDVIPIAREATARPIQTVAGRRPRDRILGVTTARRLQANVTIELLRQFLQGCNLSQRVAACVAIRRKTCASVSGGGPRRDLASSGRATARPPSDLQTTRGSDGGGARLLG